MKFLLALRPIHLKLVLIALPTILGAAYFGWIASDRYVSETIIAVRQATQESSAVPGVAMLLGNVNPVVREDTLYLRDFIHSLGLLNRIDAKLQLRKHYEAATEDPVYRLPEGIDQERFLEYFRNRVELSFDDLSSLLTVRVQGFTPGFAHEVNKAILAECERFVNDFSQRMAREQLAFSDAELQRATALVQSAKSKVLAFQAKNRMLDPIAQAQATGTLTSELQAALARQEAELRNALTYLNEGSFQIRALRGQVEATRTQLNLERSRATSGRNGERLSQLAAEFQELQLQAGFAEDTYKLALTAVENARIDTSRKMKSLVVVEPPSLPESAIYPRRLYNVLTLLVATVLAYWIVRLAIETIREHRD